MPTFAAMSLILVFPFAYTIVLSLSRSTLGMPFQAFSGLANFRQALETDAFTGSLWRTTAFALLAAMLEVVIGVAVALVLHLRGTRFGILGTILLLPMVTPPIMVGVAWQLLLAPAGGGLSSQTMVTGTAADWRGRRHGSVRDSVAAPSFDEQRRREGREWRSA